MDRAAELESYMMEQVGYPFEFAVHDCVTLAADWVLRVRGFDFAAEFRENAKGSDAATERARVGGLLKGASVALLAHGLSPVRPELARVGDIGVVRLACGQAAMTIKAAHGWVLKTKDGLAVRDKIKVFKVWGV